MNIVFRRATSNARWRAVINEYPSTEWEASIDAAPYVPVAPATLSDPQVRELLKFQHPDAVIVRYKCNDMTEVEAAVRELVRTLRSPSALEEASVLLGQIVAAKNGEPAVE